MNNMLDFDKNNQNYRALSQYLGELWFSLIDIHFALVWKKWDDTEDKEATILDFQADGVTRTDLWEKVIQIAFKGADRPSWTNALW